MHIVLVIENDETILQKGMNVIKSNSRTYYPPTEDEVWPTKKLPPEERRKSRHFKLEDVFKDADTADALINELPWFYDLTTWEEYSKLISSGHHEEIKRPYGFVTGHISIGEIDSD